MLSPLGIHVGDVGNTDGVCSSCAVSFVGESIQSLFEKEKISHLIHQPNGVET